MTTTNITAYLGQGLAAARPATPAIAVNTIAFFFATDTGQLSCYQNGAWSNVGIGAIGTAPIVVQSIASVAGTNSITFGAAPTNGNLLVAMCFNPNQDTAGSGWTKQTGEVSTGTDFGFMCTKVAGASESATQTPISVSPGGTGAIMAWEISGAAATAVLAAQSQAEQALLVNASPSFPNLQGVICLAACSLVSASNSINKLYGVTQDQAIKTGTTRQVAGGHSYVNVPLAQIFTSFTGSGTPGSKSMVALITT